MDGIEFRGFYRFLSGIKGSGQIELARKKKSIIVRNEDTQFLKEIFKILISKVEQYSTGTIFSKSVSAVGIAICYQMYYRNTFKY